MDKYHLKSPLEAGDITDAIPTPQSTLVVIKKEPDQSLQAREQLLKQAAKASFGLTLARPRSEQQPPARYYKQPTPQPTLPGNPSGCFNLHDVEHTLAGLNRQLNSTSAVTDPGRYSRLLQEKHRALTVLRPLTMEHLLKKNGGLTSANATPLATPSQGYAPTQDLYPRTKNLYPPIKPDIENAPHVSNTTDRYTPALTDPYANARDNERNRARSDGRLLDRYVPGERYVPDDRYVPVDHYTPHTKTRGAAGTAKRPREQSPEEEMEVMAEAITQVNRIMKRISSLQDRSRPQKRRKGSAEGLAVALRASVEELLAKTNEVTG
ncbi:MAG: hypothetical protein Q9221_000699 [Calogaya cf. arnoldii]